MNTIPFARPSIGEEEIAAVTEVLRSGWLTTGAHAERFEAEFAETVDARHALTVGSATAGLHLVLEAAGVGVGDWVIVPSLTFTATAEIVRHLGGEVAFADVHADTMLIDPTSVRQRVRELKNTGLRVAAIIAVHLAGAPCDMPALRDIAREAGAPLIEDAAHAFPSQTADGFAGTLADAGVYSFYANKTITTGEGGMVCTDRDAWAERIRLMRNHGINREAWNRYTTDSVTAGSARPHWWYEVTAAGFKYNMPDTAAAIGRVQLARAFSFLDRRREIARRYQEAFSTEAARELIRLPHFDRGHAWHLFIVRINAERSSVDRDGAIAALADRGIGTSVHYIPLHHMPYWRERYPDHAPLPVTDSCAEEIMSLPIYPDLRDEEQDRVVAAVRAVLGVPCGPD